MRAVTKYGGLVEVIVVELGAVNSEAFRSWSNNSARRELIERSLSIGRASHKETTQDLGLFVCSFW